jgi:hypothetical protein
MRCILLIICFFIHTNLNAQLSIEEIASLPEAVSNNAVCEGFIGGVPYLFSFGGIDSTKSPSGIHLRSFRVNLETGISEDIPNLPDDMGKIAAGASRIGNIIYIAGGYYVFNNFSELSSAKLHRYNIIDNTYLSDAPDIPFATDDHVQVVWRDSLIYLITGWSNTTNVPYVQIYNPTSNDWTRANNLPVDARYRSFGASGSIVGDTIYYFGGATSNAGFNIQNHLRKGIINPNNPAEVDWSISVPDPNVDGYRMACANVGNEIHWIGGSTETYNFDGIAYNGSGGVSPANRDLFSKPNPFIWEANNVNIPMDLRGIADVNDTIKYIAGGMLDNQTVTDKVYKLTWDSVISSLENFNKELEVFITPNPFNDYIQFDKSVESLLLYNLSGKVILTIEKPIDRIDLSFLNQGFYFLRLRHRNQSKIIKVIKI